ncbi:hypothetical protein [Actinophytocola oryzae]|uniref:hypothetical protein n=1 Tax=Actinophytocola oryzae TaxID=502181 RepID=UPI0010633D01|nr:hypothetical protein [Actinophytocola oryzae]
MAFLTSCSSKAAEEQPTNRPKASSVELADAETTTTTPPPNKGPIAKRLGDLAGADCADTSFDNCAMTFTITKVTDCTGGYPGDAPPTGTTRKLVWVEIQTGPSYTLTDLPSYLVTRFAAINAAGVTGGDLNPSSRWECAPTQSSIGFGDENWLPNKKYAGAVEIYLPDDAVKITNGDGFWEWALQ